MSMVLFSGKDAGYFQSFQSTFFLIFQLPGLMNGVEHQVGGFASTLRRKLFQEHLGLMNEPYYTVVDPVSEHFFKVSSIFRLFFQS